MRKIGYQNLTGHAPHITWTAIKFKKLDCKNYNLSKLCAGFTLVELLVVVSIIGMLSALTIVNYRARETKSRVEGQAQKFASVLKQAQSMALAGELTDGSRPDGYGVYIINSTSYVLFADMDRSQTKNSGDKDIQTYTLTNNVTVSSATNNIVFNLPAGKGILSGTTVSFLFNSQCKQSVLIDSVNGRIDLVSCP